MEEYLKRRLQMQMPPRKLWVIPVTLGVDFLGYRVYPTHRRLRTASGHRFSRRLRTMQQEYQRGQIDTFQVRQRIMSWIGHAIHADTYGLRKALLEGASFRRA